MQRSVQFLGSSLPQDFYWFNEPGHYQLGDGLEIFTDEKTDFWQRTHYGFQRDDGHCLLIKQSGDFSLTTRVEFDPRTMYDQCGLIVRIDSPGGGVAASQEIYEAIKKVRDDGKFVQHIVADLLPHLASIIAAHHVPMLLHKQHFRPRGVHGDRVHAMAYLSLGIGQLPRRFQPLVDRLPALAAIVAAEQAARRGLQRRRTSGQTPQWRRG